MDDFRLILDYVGRYIDLTEEETHNFCSKLEIKTYNKKELFAQPGHVCQFQGYVIQGCFRSYMIDSKGNEHTIQFSIEDWWVSDFSSYITQEPATLYVEALEETKVIVLKHSNTQTLYKEVPKFERFFRIIIERGFMFSQKRVLSNLSQTAEERYLDFINKYPQIEQRVPQYALASYLGFSPEFLSKIRKRLATQRY